MINVGSSRQPTMGNWTAQSSLSDSPYLIG